MIEIVLKGKMDDTGFVVTDFHIDGNERNPERIYLCSHMMIRVLTEQVTRFVGGHEVYHIDHNKIPLNKKQ